MNRISTDEYNRLLDLVLQGKSIRAICDATGLSRQTTQDKRNEILRVVSVSCDCGKDIRHVGWCKHRLPRHPKRRDFMTRWTRYQKIEWCWKVLRRLSRNRFVAKEVLKDCLIRLAHKHSKRPSLTIERLSTLTWFDRTSIGVFNGDSISSQWEAAARRAGNDYCDIGARAFCRICKGHAFCESRGNWLPTCGSEWCKRLYTFYFVEGRNRPSTVRGGKNNGLRFEFFLSDYLRRYANEQARS